jgi:hypothetical protein
MEEIEPLSGCAGGGGDDESIQLGQVDLVKFLEL